MSDKVSRRTFRDRLENMVQVLRHDILTGKYEDGAYLASESALAEQFQLSKNSVRVGLETLVREGLLIKKPRVGNIVSIPANQETITLKLGYYPKMPQEAQFKELIANFQARFPRIRVEMIVLPDSNTIKEYLDNGTVDVLTMNYSDYKYLIDKGSEDLLHPMKANSDIYSFLSDAFTKGDNLYVQPFVFSPTVLCYNRHHFYESGVPEPQKSWTWETLSEAASHLTEVSDGTRANEGKRFGFYFIYLQYNRWLNFLLQSGAKFSKGNDGRYQLSGTPIEASLQCCRNLIEQARFFPNHSSATEIDAEQLFLQQKVSMIVTTYFHLNYLSQATFAYDIAPLPYFLVPKSLLLIIGLAINQRSRQKEAAFDLIQYLLSMDVQLRIRKKTLSIPSVQAAAEWIGDEEMYRPSRFHLYRGITDTFGLTAELGISEENLRILDDSLKFYWSRMVDDKEFFEKLVTDLK